MATDWQASSNWSHMIQCISPTPQAIPVLTSTHTQFSSLVDRSASCPRYIVQWTTIMDWSAAGHATTNTVWFVSPLCSTYVNHIVSNTREREINNNQATFVSRPVDFQKTRELNLDISTTASSQRCPMLNNSQSWNMPVNLSPLICWSKSL